MTLPVIYTVAQVAEYLDLSVRTVTEMCRRRSGFQPMERPGRFGLGRPEGTAWPLCFVYHRPFRRFFHGFAGLGMAP